MTKLRTSSAAALYRASIWPGIFACKGLCRCPRVDAYSSHFYPSIDRDNLSIDLIDYYIDYYMKIVERIDCYRSEDVYIYMEILKKK